MGGLTVRTSSTKARTVALSTSGPNRSRPEKSSASSTVAAGACTSSCSIQNEANMHQNSQNTRIRTGTYTILGHVRHTFSWSTRSQNMGIYTRPAVVSSSSVQLHDDADRAQHSSFTNPGQHRNTWLLSSVIDQRRRFHISKGCLVPIQTIYLRNTLIWSWKVHHSQGTVRNPQVFMSETQLHTPAADSTESTHICLRHNSA